MPLVSMAITRGLSRRTCCALSPPARARGGFAVDMSWKDGKLVEATLHSLNGSACKVRYGDKVAQLKIPKGGSRKLAADQLSH